MEHGPLVKSAPHTRPSRLDLWLWGILLTQDSIGLAGGVNLYAYAANNPIAYSDPFGLCEPFCTAIDVAMVAADAADIAANGLTLGNGVALAVDVVAAALPFVPALAGATTRSIKATQRASQGGESLAAARCN